MQKSEQIISILKDKGKLKQKIFDNTFEIFDSLKDILLNIEDDYNKELEGQDSRVRVKYKSKGKYQCELKVAGDLLVFSMHTNIFEFDREHKIWSLQKAGVDKDSTYCGIINIYDFLSDSFKFSRIDDVGYLIARIFINKDKLFFVEGKQQMGYLSDDFSKNKITKNLLKGILESAILYSQKFDLLVPPYEAVKIINVQQILESRREAIRTGKRLGFSFKTDDISGDKLLYTGG